MTEIEFKFNEFEKVVVESVTKLADAEFRLAKAEIQLGNFDLLYDVISLFPNFKVLDKDLEYDDLNYVVK